MEWFYLIGLLIGISGLLIIDARYALAFWSNTRRTVATVVVAILIFIIWDFIGISLGIFFHGGSPYSLPFRLAPEFPLEEIVFLFLLTYCTLIIYNGVQKWLSHTS